MPTPHYLYVHIPGRGQLTLSLPGGFERAFRFGRLPENAEVWHAAAGVWLPMFLHPEIVKLQRSALSDSYDFDFLPEEIPQRIEIAADPILDALFEDAADPIELESPDIPMNPVPARTSDPAQLPLIAVDDWEIHLEEFSNFVARSSAREQRKEAVRISGVMNRESGPVVFAGVAAPVVDIHDIPPPVLARFRTRLLAGAAVLLVAMGAAGWLWYRTPNPATGSDSLAIQVASAQHRDSLANVSAASNAHFAAPNPLADLEASLESDLRIAEAVIWQPAIDFGSGEQVSRSFRKLAAVRNSIGLYRLGAWRMDDSLHRVGDPRLEPFAETSRVDAVVGIMQAAVVLLDSLTGHYRVDGEMLVFESAEDAEHYTALTRVADSLLRAPVELDSFPIVRAPRRVVTRLLSTLPLAVVPQPQPPAQPPPQPQP